jgi:hypothetical protein
MAFPDVIWPPPAANSEPLALADVVTAGVLLDVTRIFVGLLGLSRPGLASRTEALTRLVRQAAESLNLDRCWEFEVAARLSQIGWLSVPSETHAAAVRGERLSEDDWRAVASHPLVARDLLSDVRRLDGVREMIARQHEPYAVPGEHTVPFAQCDRHTQGGQLLHVCADYLTLRERGLAVDDALGGLVAEPREYNPELIRHLRLLTAAHAAGPTR